MSPSQPSVRAQSGGDAATDLDWRTWAEGPALDAASADPVHLAIAEEARVQPQAVAVSSGGQTLTYAALEAWAAELAARLGLAGVRPGDRVGILVEPGLDMVAAALGVLRAGAAYVPIHHAQPDARIAVVMQDAQLSAVVASPAGVRQIEAGLPVIDVRRQAEPAPGAAPLAVAPPPAIAPEAPAYLIYTSGSTGEPKGVVISHGRLAASTLARRQVYPGRPVFLLLSPLAFDSSVAGLWGTLTAGGRLVVAAATEVTDPEQLVALIRREAITHILCVPSLYAAILDVAERAGMAALASLRTVIVAGETLPAALVERHFRLNTADVELVNEYGPTEATVWASFHRLRRPGPVSIGRPIPGARLYVLDAAQRPLGAGAEGELFVGGFGVSEGYFERPAATARAFLPDPFAPTPGARMYRTGDQVRWNDDGTLTFLGRLDHQVKIRGHRIELGAVETELLACDGVRDAVVVADASAGQLVGFLVADAALGLGDLRRRLAERLPEAAIPSRFEVCERFPLTLTGKVDRRALQARAAPAPAAPGPVPGASSGGLAAQVTDAWREVLGVPEVAADINFFDLGGHSLMMFKLQDALERRTGLRLTIVSLFRHTTVDAQVALISAGPEAPAPTAAQNDLMAARQARLVRAAALRAVSEAAS